jgi:hypothetical protein
MSAAALALLWLVQVVQLAEVEWELELEFPVPDARSLDEAWLAEPTLRVP